MKSRPTYMEMISACLLAVLAAFAAPAVAQTPELHTAVPLVYPPPGDARRARVDQVFIDAWTQPRHAIIFGSSLYTMDGQGNNRVTAMNAMMQSIYGSSPATPWLPVRTGFGSVPASQYGIRSAISLRTNGGMRAVSGLVTSYRPPGLTPQTITNDSDGNGVSDATGIAVTNVFQLEPDNGSGANTMYSMPQRRFTTANRIFEWIGWSRGVATTETVSSTVFAWETRKQVINLGPTYFAGSLIQTVSPVDIPAPNGFSPNATTHQAARLWLPATNGAAATEVVHDPSNPYKIAMLRATGANGPDGYVAAAVRWRIKDATGLTFSSFSDGGYHIGSFEDSHANSGPTIAAAGADLVIIGLHTNSAYSVAYDARNDASPSTSFYHRGLAMVDLIRAALPGVPIIFIADHPRTTGTAGQDEQHSRMVGAMRQICDMRPDVALINLLLAAEREGFAREATDTAGLLFRNQWADATAYAVGDYVSDTGPSGIEYFRCIVAHTSASTTRPLTGVNCVVNWRAVRRGYDPAANLTTAPTDSVHLNDWGDMRLAEISTRLMLAPLVRSSPVDMRRQRFTEPGR